VTRKIAHAENAGERCGAGCFEPPESDGTKPILLKSNSLFGAGWAGASREHLWKGLGADRGVRTRALQRSQSCERAAVFARDGYPKNDCAESTSYGEFRRASAPNDVAVHGVWKLGVVAQAEDERRVETVNFDAEARSGGKRRGVFEEVGDPVKRIAGCSPGDSSRACRIGPRET